MNPLQTIPILTPTKLSARLKSLRKRHGLTQAALGERIGVKQARMADIENNPGTVSVEQMLKILHVLDARIVLEDRQH